MELRDYILAAAKDDALLAELQDQQVEPEQEAAIAEANTLQEKLIAIIKTVRDPELPVNLWDLGLIYRLEAQTEEHIEVDMTLTAAACPVAGALPVEVEKRIRRYLPEAGEVEVTLVWQPRWSKEMMSEEAKLQLDLW